MLDLEVIDDPATAVVALDPVRARLLAELVEGRLVATAASFVVSPAVDVRLGCGLEDDPVVVKLLCCAHPGAYCTETLKDLADPRGRPAHSASASRRMCSSTRRWIVPTNPSAHSDQ
jgi:hypothetical protein